MKGYSNVLYVIRDALLEGKMEVRTFGWRISDPLNRMSLSWGERERERIWEGKQKNLARKLELEEKRKFLVFIVNKDWAVIKGKKKKRKNRVYLLLKISCHVRFFVILHATTLCDFPGFFKKRIYRLAVGFCEGCFRHFLENFVIRCGSPHFACDEWAIAATFSTWLIAFGSPVSVHSNLV